MLRNMVTSLIEHERIVTTVAKAKEVQSMAEKVITMAKKPDKLHARRMANKIVRTPEAQTKLINVLGPRYKFREGGYTRIMKLARPRQGDKSDMAVLEVSVCGMRGAIVFFVPYCSSDDIFSSMLTDQEKSEPPAHLPSLEEKA